MRSWKKKIPGINEKLERCFRGIMLHHPARKIYPSPPIPIPGPEYEILYSRPSYRRELGEKWKKQIRKIHYIKIKCQKTRTTGEIRVFICCPYRSRKTAITDRWTQRVGFKRRVKNNILSWKRVRAESIFIDIILRSKGWKSFRNIAMNENSEKPQLSYPKVHCFSEPRAPSHYFLGLLITIK